MNTEPRFTLNLFYKDTTCLNIYQIKFLSKKFCLSCSSHYQIVLFVLDCVTILKNEIFLHFSPALVACVWLHTEQFQRIKTQQQCSIKNPAARRLPVVMNLSALRLQSSEPDVVVIIQFSVVFTLHSLNRFLKCHTRPLVFQQFLFSAYSRQTLGILLALV